jgi:hypothetical protein
VARENLKLWHSVGTGMYALQWLCAAIVLWRVAGTRKPVDPVQARASAVGSTLPKPWNLKS